MFEIKELTQELIPGKGYVHYTAWNETYSGLIDERFLSKRSLQKCVEFANILFGKEDCFVALVNNEVVGFISFNNTSRNRSDYTEILALYVLKKNQNIGVGTALLNKAFEEITNQNIHLFVLDNNIKAINFYKRHGFQFSGVEKIEDLKVTTIRELEMIMTR